MQRLISVNPQAAQGRTKELFDTVQQAFGVIPNTAKVMANSPAVLGSFLLAGRTGHSEDRRTKAALAFASDVLESSGKVSNPQLAAVREAGFGDAEIVEIVASVVLGCFTNFLNNVADTELDIP